MKENLFNVYAFYDRVAEEFSPPNIYRNDKVATRHFVKLLNESEYKDDYLLYKIGTFDMNSGDLKDQKNELIPFVLGDTDELEK